MKSGVKGTKSFIQKGKLFQLLKEKLEAGEARGSRVLQAYSPGHSPAASRPQLQQFHQADI